MSDPKLLLTSYLKTLRLPTFLREYPAVARQCGEKDMSYELFLQRLAELEVQHRQVQSIARRIKLAAFRKGILRNQVAQFSMRIWLIFR